MTAPLTYEHLADVFSKAMADTGGIADALRVTDAYRLRTSVRSAELDSFEVISAAAKHFGISFRRIVRHDRHRTVCDARWVVAKILHDWGWSFVRIGMVLGLTHSSVIHAVREVHERPDLMAAAEAILTNDRARKAVP
jgi:chromosomal replication initiation ATPase DnaA